MILRSRVKVPYDGEIYPLFTSCISKASTLLSNTFNRCDDKLTSESNIIKAKSIKLTIKMDCWARIVQDQVSAKNNDQGSGVGRFYS